MTVPSVVWTVLKGRGVVRVSQERQCNRIFRAYETTEVLKVRGSFEASLEVGGETTVEGFYVTEGGDRCLLGLYTAIKRGLCRSEQYCRPAVPVVI